MGPESHSASQPGLDKPPSTPEMSTHNVEAMANSMLLDSPLPMRRSQRMAEAAGFQEKERAKSFLRGVMINSMQRSLHVSL